MHRNWRELIKPKRLDVDEETHNSYYGEFECEPLERGFGVTIGNSLRRILLSSFRGPRYFPLKSTECCMNFPLFPVWWKMCRTFFSI